MKTALNSSLGKLIQALIDESITMVNDDATLDKYILNHTLQSMEIISDTVVQATISKNLTNRSAKQPSHLGVFVLSYSKRIMNRFLNSLNGFNTYNMIYTDTDSMFLDEKCVKILKKLKGTLPAFGKNLGQIHCDLPACDDGKIVKGIFLAPKTYALQYIYTNE